MKQRAGFFFCKKSSIFPLGLSEKSYVFTTNQHQSLDSVCSETKLPINPKSDCKLWKFITLQVGVLGEGFSATKKYVVIKNIKVVINPFCGLSVIFCGFISHLIDRETINIPDTFSGVHGFTGKTVIRPGEILKSVARSLFTMNEHAIAKVYLYFSILLRKCS